MYWLLVGTLFNQRQHDEAWAELQSAGSTTLVRRARLLQLGASLFQLGDPAGDVGQPLGDEFADVLARRATAVPDVP